MVPAGDDAVERFADDGVVGGVYDRSEQGGAAFGSLAVGDLTGDLGGADYASLGIFDRRDGEGNVDERTVFALAYGIEVFNPFTAADAGEDLFFLCVAILGDDQGDVASDGLFGTVAEDAFS